jgi:hypothetical protein
MRERACVMTYFLYVLCGIKLETDKREGIINECYGPGLTNGQGGPAICQLDSAVLTYSGHNGLISPFTSTTQIDEYVCDTLCLSRPTRKNCYTLLSVAKQKKARHFVTLIFGIVILRKYKPPMEMQCGHFRPDRAAISSCGSDQKKLKCPCISY